MLNRKAFIGSKSYWVMIIFFVFQLSNFTYATEILHLSKQQTIGLTNFNMFDIWNAYRGANKNALTMVRQIINSGTEININSTCKLLGMIGTKEDLPFIEKNIADMSKKDSSGVWMGLGFMARRGIIEAGNLIDKGLTTEYWDKLNCYKYSKEVIQGQPRFKYDLFYDVFIAYLISGKGKPEKRKEKLLQSIQNKKIKVHLQRILKIKSMRKYISGIISGKRLTSPLESSGRPKSDVLLKLLDNAGYRQLENYRKRTQESVTKPTKTRTGGNGTKSTSVRTYTEITKNKSKDNKPYQQVQNAQKTEYLLSISKIALSEYEGIISKFKEKNIFYIANKITDGGKPLSSKKVFAKKTNLAMSLSKSKGFQQALVQTNILINAIEALKPQYGITEIDIKTTHEYISTANGYSIKQSNERIVVTIPLLGTSKLATELKLRNPPRPPKIIDGNGNILIIMIRENEKWYWNPFGW